MTYQEWILETKWFPEANPVNPKYSSISIGSGDNGVVTVSYGITGTSGNDYSLEVVAGSGLNIAMTATITDKKITITLGTDGAGALSATKNTATLIATAVDALNGFNAVASGTGVTAITGAIANANFSGGQYGTPCPEQNVLVYATPYYYLCTIAGNKDDVEWKRFTPSTY